MLSMLSIVWVYFSVQLNSKFFPRKGQVSEIPVTIINLVNETDRCARAVALLSQISMQVSRIEGVNSTSEHLRYLLTPLQSNLCYRDDDFGVVFDREYWGVLGCTLSHLKAISELYEKRTKVAIIVEDDAVTDLSPFWTSSFDEFIKNLPTNWTIVQLSLTGTEDMWSRAFSEWQQNRRSVAVNYEFWGTVAYLINRRGIEHIVSAYGFGKFDLSKLECINADVHLLKSAVPAGSYYIATPPLLTFTDDMKSSVHDTNLHTPLGQNPSSHRAHVHAISRQYALEWSALNWRNDVAQQARIPTHLHACQA
jgi:GR25 family glycosyltransferase involved in LPS biosynthesis